MQQAEAQAAKKLIVTVAGPKDQTAIVGQRVQSFQYASLPSHRVHRPRQLEQNGAVQTSVDTVQRQAQGCTQINTQWSHAGCDSWNSLMWHKN